MAKRKEAQREAAAGTAELEKLRAQSTASARMMAEIQASNAALRAAAAQSQRPTSQSGGGGAEPGGSAGAQLAALETLLERRDREVADLRQALAGSSAQLQKLALQGE